MEWISATDRLPAEGERVLLYTPYEIFGDDHACIGNKAGLASCKMKKRGKVVPVFTHWMPLPEKPHVC